MVHSVGQRLRQRREARGLGLEAVIRATRLTRGVLIALEADQFGDIAAPVYVRGFLRIYSQYLELDVEQTLEAYERQVTLVTEEAPVAPASQLPDYFRAPARTGRSLSPAQLFLLVATAAIVVVFMWSANRKRPVQLAGRHDVHAAPATATGPAAPAPALPGARVVEPSRPKP